MLIVLTKCKSQKLNIVPQLILLLGCIKTETISEYMHLGWNLFLAVLANATCSRSRKMNFLYFRKTFKDVHYPTVKKVCNRLSRGLFKYTFFVKKAIMIFFFFFWSVVKDYLPVLFFCMTQMHTVPQLKILAACMRTNKAKSPGVSIRSDQKEYHCFPRVG